MDYTRPNLDLVKEGKVYGLVAQPLYEEFYSCAETSWARRSMARRWNTTTCCRPDHHRRRPVDKYYAFNDRAEAGIAGKAEPKPSHKLAMHRSS